MSVNFEALLSTQLDDVKRPPVKPPGTYYGVVTDIKFDMTSGKTSDKKPYAQLTFSQIEAGPDVDQSLLRDSDGETIDLTAWKPRTSGLSNFYLNSEAVFRIKEFMESLGINTTGRSLGECIPEIKGQPVQLTVSLKPTEDGQNFFNNIDKIEARK